MTEHKRRHVVPQGVSVPRLAGNGNGAHTEELMDGMQKVRAIAVLVESAIVWRSSYIAWNHGVDKAEPLLSRLVFKEGSENPQALDLLARIYFQQGKFEKARGLWLRAHELQPGNPALRRTTTLMESIARSPLAALAAYRIRLLLKCFALLALVCLAGWGANRSYKTLMNWSEGPLAVQNLEGRFHYDYESVTKGMTYIPEIPLGESATGEVEFLRKKISSGAEIGRTMIYVERSGSTLRASGHVPSLHVRYLVEQALWDMPGITQVDLRSITVERGYRVKKGDSLWIIARHSLGEGSAWSAIAKYNDLENPNLLRVGQDLTLPLGDETLEVSIN